MEIKAIGVPPPQLTLVSPYPHPLTDLLEEKIILREAIRIYGRHFVAENADFLDHPLFSAFVGRFRELFDQMIFPTLNMT